VFKPIQFTFNPPKTVPFTTAVSSGTVATDQAAQKPLAQDLVDQISLLDETSSYLQQSILHGADGVVIPVDPTRKPDVASALERIYGQTPAGISAAMYSNLLDTQMAVTRAEIQMKGMDTGLKVNPVQKADVLTAINEYEQQAVESGDFQANVSLLLNQLKGDQVIFQNMKEGLSEYHAPRKPIIAPESQSSDSDTQQLDVSPDIHQSVKQRLDGWQTYYSVTHEIVNGVDSVYNDLVDIMNTYFYQPIDLLLKLVAAVSGLKSLLVKPKLQDLRASLVWLVYPRLISEVSKYTFLMDRYVQKATDPVFNILGSVNRLFGQACKSAADVAYMVGKGNFSGLRQQIGYQWNPAAQRRRDELTKKAGGKLPSDSELVKEIDALSAGFASFQGHIAKAVQTAKSKRDRTTRSMMKLLDCRLLGTSDRLELVQTLRTVQSIINILNSMAQEMNRISPGTAPNNILGEQIPGVGHVLGEVQGNNGSLGSVISGMEQGSGLSISLQADNKVKVSKTKLAPPPSTAVAKALADHLPERSING
jgi:hypothetical protein